MSNKELFLRYAIPCGEVLVKRGDLNREVLKKLDERTRDGKDTKLPVEKYFPVAGKMCEILASRAGKSRIDEEDIRRYFLREHDKAIRWRRLFFKDVNLKECLVKPGRVMKAGEKTVLNTPLGRRVLEKNFEPEIRRNDWVSFHYDHICERLSSEQAKSMLRSRK